MGYQPSYGERIYREHYAEEEIHFYRIVKKGTSANLLKQGTADCTPVGITISSELGPTTVGTVDSFAADTIPEVQRNGLTYIELGETVAADTLVKSDSVGRGVDGSLPTSVTPADLAMVAGTILEGGDVGDIVRIDMDRKV